MQYEEFNYQPLSEVQIEKIKEHEIDIDTARKFLTESDDFLFIRFKEDKIEEARNSIFGNTKIVVEIDKNIPDLHFFGVALNNQSSIEHPLDVLNSIEPYIENIFM